MRIHAVLGAFAAVAVCACSSSSSTPGAGNPEDAAADHAAPKPDAAVVDAEADGTTPPDGAPPDDAGALDAADTSVPLACPAWDGSVESPACTDCLRASCCAPTSACQNDPTCVALDSCVNDCLTADAGGDDDGGDPISDCANACFSAQTQATRDEYHAFSDCIGTTCGGNSGAGPCL